jgi:hypothetical protein
MVVSDLQIYSAQQRSLNAASASLPLRSKSPLRDRLQETQDVFARF